MFTIGNIHDLSVGKLEPFTLLPPRKGSDENIRNVRNAGACSVIGDSVGVVAELARRLDRRGGSTGRTATTIGQRAGEGT